MSIRELVELAEEHWAVSIMTFACVYRLCGAFRLVTYITEKEGDRE